MTNHGLKAYDKYSVKKDRSDRQMKNADGTPVLDELISSRIMLTQEDMKFLNGKWDQFGYYYVSSDEKKEVAKSSPNQIDGESLKKDLTIEKLKEFTPEEVDAVLSVMSKSAMFSIVGIDVPKNKLNLVKVSEAISEVKTRLNELKKD